MDITVFQAFSEWVSQNFLASAIAGGITWDIIKGHLLIPFKNKFLKYFEDENQVEKYFKDINTIKSINIKKPSRDIEDIYEDITNNTIPKKFIDEMINFIEENKLEIEKMNLSKGDFEGLQQYAGRDINNVKGTQNIINIGSE